MRGVHKEHNILFCLAFSKFLTLDKDFTAYNDMSINRNALNLLQIVWSKHHYGCDFILFIPSSLSIVCYKEASIALSGNSPQNISTVFQASDLFVRQGNFGRVLDT